MPFVENRNVHAECDRCMAKIGFHQDHVVFPRHVEEAHRDGRIQVKESSAMTVLCLHCDARINADIPPRRIDLALVARVLRTSPADAAMALDCGLVDQEWLILRQAFGNDFDPAGVSR